MSPYPPKRSGRCCRSFESISLCSIGPTTYIQSDQYGFSISPQFPRQQGYPVKNTSSCRCRATSRRCAAASTASTSHPGGATWTAAYRAASPTEWISSRSAATTSSPSFWTTGASARRPRRERGRHDSSFLSKPDNSHSRTHILNTKSSS